jgi:urease subunit beta
MSPTVPPGAAGDSRPSRRRAGRRSPDGQGTDPPGGGAPPSGPGALWLAAAPVELFPGRPTRQLVVRNIADRAIQVGSHVHFAQTNPGLAFDRAAARGWRLAVPAGTSVRFEPGVERQVTLVPLAGARRVPGLRRDLPGPTGDDSADGNR